MPQFCYLNIVDEITSIEAWVFCLFALMLIYYTLYRYIKIRQLKINWKHHIIYILSFVWAFLTIMKNIFEFVAYQIRPYFSLPQISKIIFTTDCFIGYISQTIMLFTCYHWIFKLQLVMDVFWRQHQCSLPVNSPNSSKFKEQTLLKLLKYWLKFRIIFLGLFIAIPFTDSFWTYCVYLGNFAFFVFDISIFMVGTIVMLCWKLSISSYVDEQQMTLIRRRFYILLVISTLRMFADIYFIVKLGMNPYDQNDKVPCSYENQEQFELITLLQCIFSTFLPHLIIIVIALRMHTNNNENLQETISNSLIISDDKTNNNNNQVH